MQTCSEKGCAKTQRSRGLCSKHYQRMLREERQGKLTVRKDTAPLVAKQKPVDLVATRAIGPSPAPSALARPECVGETQWRLFLAACTLLDKDAGAELTELIGGYASRVRAAVEGLR
jgi:hypothetical protein